MAQAIEEYWAPGDYAVAVTDLQTGETVGVNEARSQLSACVANLFVLFQTARDIEAGKYTADDVDWLVSTTTWSSDANAARELYGFVGGGDFTTGIVLVNSLIHDVLGLDAVILDHPPGFDDSISLDPNNWVTAEAVNRALLAFWLGDVVGAEGRAYLLDHLATVKPGLNYLTAAVPEGVVSHKNGFLEADTGFVDNDAGIIRLTRGDTEYAYALTFLSQEVTSKYDDIVLGQQLGALAYEVMAARYP
jgi:beta-lactamase class A